MKNIKNWLPAALFFSLIHYCVPSSALDILSQIKTSKSVTIAHRENAIPFSYLSDQNKPMGYSIDICHKLIAGVQRELKLPKLSFNYLLVNSSNRWQAITDAAADIECGVSVNTSERRKQVAFTIPHFFSATRLLVRTDSAIKNWRDLKNKKLVTIRGTATMKVLNQNEKLFISEMKLQEASTAQTALTLLEQGQCDAIAMDELSLHGMRATAKNPQQFVVVGDAMGIETFAMVLPKDDVAWKAIIDKEMARLMTSGEITQLYDKWFTQITPQKNINFLLPMGFLLRDSLHFPTDKLNN